MSEPLILASANPQYDNRLFIELWVQCMKIPSLEHVVNKNCTELVIQWTICCHGLVDARISASEKDLPESSSWKTVT